MADWDTAFKDDVKPSPTHSHQSSGTSGISLGNKENNVYNRMDSEVSTEDSERELIIRGGEELKQESGTESNTFDNLGLTNGDVDHTPEIPSRTVPFQPNGNSNSGTAKSRAAKSPYAPSTINSIEEEVVNIPKDGNLSSFTAEQMVNFFRCLRVDDRVISHLHRKNVTGKRFARMKDSELEAVGMKNNSVVLYFRERSSVKTKKGGDWCL